MQRHRRQKRTILSGLPRPKIRPNWRRSQVGETQQKSPHFVGVFPIFRPFCPSKWEKSPNRSLSGGTGRARGRNQHQPSRGITTFYLHSLYLSLHAGININPVAGLQLINTYCKRFALRCRNQHQPSRGITTTSRVRPPCKRKAGININPVAGLQQYQSPPPRA